MCEDFLKDEESYRRVADKLVQISHCFGFDGWLINIENKLSVSKASVLTSKTNCLGNTANFFNPSPNRHQVLPLVSSSSSSRVLTGVFQASQAI